MTQPAEPSGMIDVVDPVGRRGQIPVTQLPDAQAQGYIIAQPEEKGVYETAIAKGFNPVQAGAASVLSPLLSYEQGTVAGATGGLGEGVQRKIAGVVGPVLARATGGPDMTTKEAEEFYRYLAQGGAHSGLHATGEVAGMVGSSIAGGALKGASGAAGVAGRGLGLITEAGEGAAAGARALTGGLAARGILGRAAAAGTELGARAGIEMGAYEGLKELSEEMFGDAPLSAQKIFAAAADGAEGGALFGGVAGAGGSLVKSAAKGIANTALQAASKNADSLQRLADEQRWKALDPLNKFSKEAEARVPGGEAAVGARLREYGVFDGTLADAAKADATEVSKRIDSAVDKVGQKLGEMTEASTATVKYGAIDDALEAVIKDERLKGGHDAIVRSLEDYKASLASKILPEVAPGASAGTEAALREVPITIQDAIFQRKALDDLIYKESKALDPSLRVGLLRDFRRKFEGVIVDAFDDAAKAAGNPGAREQLLKLKGDYQALKLAQDAAAETTSRMATNRNLSLTDYISGGIASSIGAGIGQAVGGDYGGAIGGVLGGAVGARLNRFARARGNAITAAIADRVAAFGGKERVIAKLAEAAPALEKEAIAAEKVAAAAPQKLEVPPPKALTYQPEANEAFVKKMNGIVYDEDMPMIRAEAKRVFGDRVPTPEAMAEVWKAPVGYKTVLEDMSAKEGKGITFGGEIRTDKGQQVGNFLRTFNRDEAGNLIVKHDHLHIDPEFQGKGIAKAMQQSALESYADMGVQDIHLTAGYDAGPKVWAKMGFQWANPEERTAIQQLFRDYLEANGVKNAESIAAKATETPKSLLETRVEGKPVGEDFLGSGEASWAGKMAVSEGRAQMLQKAAEFARAKEAIAKVDAQIEKSAQGLVEPKGNPYRESAKPIRDRYEAARANADQLADNLQAIMRRADVKAASMPKISKAMQDGVIRAAAFLTSAGPPPVNQLPTLGAPLPRATTVQAMGEYLDRYEAVNNPMKTLRKFESGRVTVPEVQALKVASPELFAEIQKRCFNVVVARQAAGKPVPFQARQRLHVLLGIPTDPSQDPKLTKLLQSYLQTQEPAPQTQAPSRPVQMPKLTNTFDRLEEG